jgi:uncharacterized protein DUF6982/PilZ domain-containing protein
MSLELLSSESAAPLTYVDQAGGVEGADVQAESDRRAHPRLSAGELGWFRTARIKNGPRVTLIDLSVGGALLESDNRLCPGSVLALELVGSSPIVVPLRVVRSQIASLREGALYRGACAFKRPLELPDLIRQSFKTTAPPPLPPPNSAQTRTGASQLSVGWSMVILRYLDGRALKGFSNDFSAARTQFHLWPTVGAPPSEQMIVPLSRLKAVFFVRDFDGNPTYVERQEFETAPTGRKIEVTFLDGEVIVGSTLSYRPEGTGFFLCPADTRSNNVRIFVVCGSVRHARFI